jgi:hypothetical protein
MHRQRSTKKQSLKLIMSISSVHNIPSNSTFRKQTLGIYGGLEIAATSAKLDQKRIHVP